MRRRSRRMLAAFVVSVTSVALVTAGAFVASATVGSRPATMTAVPEAPYTTFTLDGRPGANLVHGARIIDPVTVSAALDGYLFFRGSQLDSMKAVLRPPLGTAWVAGQTYETHDQEPTASRARLEIYGEGKSCNAGTGSFPGTLAVHEVEYNDAEMVAVFAASYTFWCGSASDAVAGELRWNSSVGWKSAVPEPAMADFGTVTEDQPADPVTVTLTSHGSSPITFGSSRLEYEQASDFSVTADGCAGLTLEYGETCTVTVVASPHELGGTSTFLIVPDDTHRGYRYVELRANIAGFPPVTMTGPPPTTTSPPPTTPPGPPAWDNEGTFYPLAPARILDTREGNGAPRAKLRAGKELLLDVAGRGGVPDQGVSAVVLNVTVTNPTAASFLTVYPAGQSRPVASSLNFVSGWTGANMVTVGLGSGGAVRIYNHAGTVDVIADVIGFYAADGSMVASLGTGSHYNTGPPFRVFDSREDWDGERLPGGYAARVWLPVGEVWAPHITAVAVNVTAVDGVAPGFLTTWDGEGDPPLASTLNFVRGNVVPNMAIVPVSLCDECDGDLDGIALPSIGIYTNVDTHLVVDVMGIFDDAELGEAFRFRPMAPQRIADSRTGQGLPGALGRGQSRTVDVPSSIVADDVVGLALNVTAVDPTAYSFVSVWPEGFSQPTVSNLNTAPGQTLPNSVYTMLGWLSSDFNVYNHDGRTHLVVDVVGTFYVNLDDEPSLAGSPRASVETRWLEGDAGPALLQRSGRDGFAVG